MPRRATSAACLLLLAVASTSGVALGAEEEPLRQCELLGVDGIVLDSSSKTCVGCQMQCISLGAACVTMKWGGAEVQGSQLAEYRCRREAPLPIDVCVMMANEPGTYYEGSIRSCVDCVERCQSLDGACAAAVWAGITIPAEELATYECPPEPTVEREVDCTLPPETGMGRAYFEHYFYNSTSGLCEVFVWGGLGGNSNNFETEEACLDECAPPPEVDCTLPPETGMGRAYFEHYFYNATSGLCEVFVWGGADGNSNNFDTEQACMDECAATIEEGTSTAGVEPTAEPEADCTLPPETGMGRAYFEHYFYNSTSGQCEEFVWGGADGNSNNFETEQACMDECVPVDCSLPAETGPGAVYIEHYFYNSTSGTCEMFVYGGLGGNSNNFETEEACLDECAPPPEVDCTLPPETGMGFAYFEHYFYNATSGQCEVFVWGGADGNSNNFETEEACMDECAPPPPSPTAASEVDCTLPPETGMGRAYFEHYFYNSTSGLCEMFVWGGIGGNSNNFATISECDQACTPDEPTCPGMCTLIYAPVCGLSTNTTYGNDCNAQCAGVGENYCQGECADCNP